ncbi:hypothetical protein ACFQPG_03050 [Sphingomonas sp. GCM10030256]|uniref:hypothetical protein n=1 Tax=Sphingomonas sp. GCM10030256 TaxID=3273427 RepID=UPI00361BEFD3
MRSQAFSNRCKVYAGIERFRAAQAETPDLARIHLSLARNYEMLARRGEPVVQPPQPGEQGRPDPRGQSDRITIPPAQVVDIQS